MDVQRRALSIEVNQQDNNIADSKSNNNAVNGNNNIANESPQDPCIVQVPSLDSEELTKITLNKHNTCIARYPNNQKAKYCGIREHL